MQNIIFPNVNFIQNLKTIPLWWLSGLASNCEVKRGVYTQQFTVCLNVHREPT